MKESLCDFLFGRTHVNEGMLEVLTAFLVPLLWAAICAIFEKPVGLVSI
jgi:hypothetical protein